MNDRIFQRLIKNSAYLISGNIITSLSGLVVITIIANSLGSEKLGILVLIQSYVLIIDRLVNFQSWQVIIKYASSETLKPKNGNTSKLIKFGFTIDILSSVIGTIVAILGVYFASNWFEWGKTTSLMAILYSLTILFHIEGTPTGVLRLFNKFKVFTVKDLTISLLRLCLVLIVQEKSPTIEAFLSIYMITEILGYVFLNYFAFKELRNQNVSGIINSKLKNINLLFPKIWEFIWTTNLHGSLRLLTMEADVLVVGGFLGNSAAGTYKIAKKFSLILNKLFQPLYSAIYPELSKLHAQNKILQFKHLVVKSGLTAGFFSFFVWVIFYFGGVFIINHTIGDTYLEIMPVTLYLMAAVCISITTFPFTPSLLAMGKPKYAFNILLISTLIYLPVLMYLLNNYGLIGAGIAYLVFYIVWSTTMGVAFLKQLLLIK